jgi:hypothetical protein
MATTKLKSGDFIPLAESSQRLYPKLTTPFKVKANNDWFSQMYDLGAKGLMSPDNSYPPLNADRQRVGWVVV